MANTASAEKRNRQAQKQRARNVQVRTGSDEAKAETKDASGDLSFVNYFLLAFAATACVHRPGLTPPENLREHQQQVQAIENNLAAFFHSNKLKQAVIKRYCRFLNIDVNSLITKYELDETDSSFQEIKKDNLSKRLKKYIYLSIAAFITTLLWKLFA